MPEARCRPAILATCLTALLAGACGRALPAADGPPAPDISAVPAQPAPAEPLRRPNVIFILADDLDLELGSMAVMPQVRQLLADQGTSLDSHYISFPTCCPSRSTMLRGQYVHSHRILTNAPPAGGYEKILPLGLESSTVGVWLRDAGYRTVYAGKYLNGYPLPSDPLRVPPGWSEWYSPVDETAYGSFDYRMNENGSLVSYGSRPEDHITDVLGGHAEAALRRAITDPRPFFIHLSTFAPHAPAVPAPRHKDLFPDARVPRTAAFDEVDVSDKPSRIQFLPPLHPDQMATMDVEHRARLQSLQAVDELVARLMAVLSETGHRDDTYVIFSSDNGYHLGQHRLLAGKTTAYEEDIHVPFIIRGPDIPAGRRVSGLLTGNVDLAPTLAELAGAAVPAFVEGRSLLTLLRGEPIDRALWRQAYLLEGYAGGYRSQRGTPVASPVLGLPGFGVIAPPDDFDLTDSRTPAEIAQEAPNPTREVHVGLRTPRFTFVEIKPAELEFYDNLADPLQLDNLAASLPPAYLAALSAWAAELHACQGADCRALESRPLPEPPVTSRPTATTARTPATGASATPALATTTAPPDPTASSVATEAPPGMSPTPPGSWPTLHLPLTLRRQPPVSAAPPASRSAAARVKRPSRARP